MTRTMVRQASTTASSAHVFRCMSASTTHLAARTQRLSESQVHQYDLRNIRSLPKKRANLMPDEPTRLVLEEKT
jgi:hypothetical protein